MDIIFEKMNENHQKEIMEIFNYYISNGTAVFIDKPVPEAFYTMLLKKGEGYPCYAVINPEKNLVIGFCMMSPFKPFQTFYKAAAITYFISKEFTGKGVGKKCLLKLEEDAAKMGITNLIAEISSENNESIEFHKKNGFDYAGELKNIGTKLNRNFSVVYMQKCI